MKVQSGDMAYNGPELTPEEREEQMKRDEVILAELIIEAMEASIKDGSWDPREGVAGLERLVTKDGEDTPSQSA